MSKYVDVNVLQEEHSSHIHRKLHKIFTIFGKIVSRTILPYLIFNISKSYRLGVILFLYEPCFKLPPSGYTHSISQRQFTQFVFRVETIYSFDYGVDTAALRERTVFN